MKIRIRRRKQTPEKIDYETIDPKMGILLSLPGFHITPTSNSTATMFLNPSFDLGIDINKNPGAWGALRKRGGLRTEVKLRGGPVPDEAIEAADKLIKVYQAALVDKVLELESRAEKEGKEELEILRPPKKNNKIPFQHEENKPAATVDPVPEVPEEVQERKEVTQDGQKQNIVSVPAGGSEERKTQEQDKETEFSPEESEALEILTAQDPEEIQEEQSSGADPEEESQPEIKIEEIQVQENTTGGELLFRKEFNPPITYNPEDPEIEYQNHKWEKVETEKAPEFQPFCSYIGSEIKEVKIQDKGPGPENEIYINRNSNGYSWRITARAASMEEAVENAIRANEKLKESLIPKSE